jgi:hypothetical protein
MLRRALVTLALTACTSATATPAAPESRDGAHDFDFEIGTWRTEVKRRAPLATTDEWIAYSGTTRVLPIWGGKANLAELIAEGPAGRIEVLSLRLYDPATRKWTLNVASSRGADIGPPSVGGFEGGRGEFVAREQVDGQDVLVRFVISEITADSARFEQAFSADGGKTWVPNWIATDTRIAP